MTVSVAWQPHDSELQIWKNKTTIPFSDFDIAEVQVDEEVKSTEVHEDVDTGTAKVESCWLKLMRAACSTSASATNDQASFGSLFKF